MAECYRCGVSDEDERLFDAISAKGVIKICKNCSMEEDLPIIQPVDLNKPERVKSVYERLSNMAKLDPEKHRKMILDRAREDAVRKRAQDTTLKDVIDRNLEKKKLQPRTDLIPNFHWVLMRMRRSKKLTQKQLAEKIGEPEEAIKRAEEGILLNNSDVLIRKLESYLGVRIREGKSPYSLEGPTLKTGAEEDSAKKEARERLEKEGKLDPSMAENLTISDLQEINKKKEEEGSGGFFSFLKRKKKKEDTDSEEEEENMEEGDISKEEADKILFGE